jgi:hypothetical protein
VERLHARLAFDRIREALPVLGAAHGGHAPQHALAPRFAVPQE